jgi:hypothetical protein
MEHKHFTEVITLLSAPKVIAREKRISQCGAVRRQDEALTLDIRMLIAHC